VTPDYGEMPGNVVPIALPTPFIVGPVNVFLIKQDPVTLVDTGVGSEESHAALVRALRQQGLQISDIEVILVTHGHVDHIGQLSRLLDESGAHACAHGSVVPHTHDAIDNEARSREFLLQTFREFGVPEEIVQLVHKVRDSFKGMSGTPQIHKSLKEGDKILDLGVFHVPGHSSSDTLFVNTVHRFAFTGDHVLKGVNPTPLIRRDHSTGGRVRSMLEYELSLARTRALDLEVMYPGHGQVINSPKEVIDRILLRQERRTRKVHERLKTGPATPHEVSVDLFPELPPEHTFLALSTAIGHLDLLEHSGAACARFVDGVYSYSVT